MRPIDGRAIETEGVEDFFGLFLRGQNRVDEGMGDFDVRLNAVAEIEQDAGRYRAAQMGAYAGFQLTRDFER